MPVLRISCQYAGPRESVHIKLLVSPVSFSHNNVRLPMVYRPLLTVRLAVSEIKPVQSQTDRRTDRQTELSTTVTLAVHVREG